MEINPRKKFSFKRNSDNLKLSFEEKVPKDYSLATQGILVIFNNKLNAVFGEEVLAPNIKASYRDYYLRKEEFQDPFQNIILKNLKKVKITSSIYFLSLQIKKVSEQISKYQKLNKTDLKLVLSLTKNNPPK